MKCPYCPNEMSPKARRCRECWSGKKHGLQLSRLKCFGHQGGLKK